MRRRRGVDTFTLAVYMSAGGRAQPQSELLLRIAMIIHRILLVALVATSATWAHPQRQRQSPLSMGMRFLGNLRDGVTKTFQGIFGGGNTRQTKEQLQGRPFQQQLVPRPPSGPVQPHGAHEAVLHSSSHTTAPPSSFFTVLHEAPEASTAFPDIKGFTDESFKPSTFFNGHTPFQGTVEEEELPLVVNEVAVSRPETNIFARPPSFLVTHDPQADKHIPPSHNSQTSTFSSFGKAPLDTPIPFGNSATFSLGKLRDSSSDSPFPFRDAEEDKDALRPSSLTSGQGPRPTPFVQRLKPSVGSPARVEPTSRPFVHRPHPTTRQFIQQTRPTSRPHSSLKPKPSSTFFKASSPFKPSDEITKAPKQSFTSSDPAVPSTAPIRPQAPSPSPTLFRHTPSDVTHHAPPAREVRPQREAFKKPVRPAKVGGGHINTGTKMTVVSTLNEDGTQATQVKGYEFGYGVLDGSTGNQFYHAEKREEGLTKGSYKIQLPDGRVQTVTYVADGNGFHPKITYEGEAQYPNAEPKDAA
ncbi:proteoglycan 4-like [Penaeus monodon]|uniref:proteoglycan 4-like n=1 Tax=Penaeus monodon TaxID=6687 RepID=UPI0018A6D601|nr:proteoglycan 4-like [Penaeus monodon]